MWNKNLNLPVPEESESESNEKGKQFAHLCNCVDRHWMGRKHTDVDCGPSQLKNDQGRIFRGQETGLGHGEVRKE